MTAHAAPRSHWVAAMATLGFTAVPADASAHLMTTGLGPLFDGAAHFAMSPEAMLPVVALAIFAGLNGVAHARAAVQFLPATWLLSGFLGLLVGPLGISGAYESVPLIVLGSLAAANPSVPVWGTASLSILLGIAGGYGLGSEPSGARDGTLAVLGATLVAFVLVALVAAAVLKARWDWTRITARVVGSWTAACGVLLLGWALR
ncbi:HupE/UreJ protein [Rhizobium subbaraonis]|uniref:HupE/UreJ protein n=2 Tax=Rhizobium subbaraonis TaxID=908946 RepID=A0A285UMM8_9HYPH|nr:HupE/UreJ protein [Rhizobium subbaraonis]